MNDNELNYEILAEILNRIDEDKERRKGPDLICKMSTILGLSAWVLMLAVWIVLEMAAPTRESRFITSFFDVTFGTAPLIRANWDYALVYTAYILLLASLGTCTIAFLLNKMRMRRKDDKYKKSIFIIGGISFIAMVVFLINFWPVLF